MQLALVQSPVKGLFAIMGVMIAIGSDTMKSRLDNLVNQIVPRDTLKRVSYTTMIMYAVLGIMYFANADGSLFAIPAVLEIVPNGYLIYSAQFIAAFWGCMYMTYIDDNPSTKVFIAHLFPLVFHVVTIVTIIPDSSRAALPAAYILYGVANLLIVLDVKAVNMPPVHITTIDRDIERLAAQRYRDLKENA